jgi:hypothetical protein
MDISGLIVYVLLACVLGIVAFVVWFRKKVNPPPPPPSLTLTVTPTSCIQGDTVVFNGTLMQGSNPLTNETVAIALIPPSGDGINLNALTDASGAFSKSWVSETPTGNWKVQVAYAGATTVERTFTRTQPIDGKPRDIGLDIFSRVGKNFNIYRSKL